MNKFLLIFALFPICSFAQVAEVPEPKHELGLNTFSITDFERGLSVLDKREYTADFSYFSGVYYKMHFGKNVFRSSFDFRQKTIDINNGDPNDPYVMYYYSASGLTKSLHLSTGYEREFGSKKLRPFVFSDLVFNYSNSKGVSTSYGCFGSYENRPFNEEVFEYGLAGGAGIRYHVAKNILLSYEFSAQGLVSVFQDLSNIGYKYRDLDYHLNPVNKLGFAVSF